MNTTPKLRISPLSGPHQRHGVSVNVQIYKRADASGWTLEIVDQYARSTLWDAEFSSDTEAFREFLKTVNARGLESLLDRPPTRH